MSAASSPAASKETIVDIDVSSEMQTSFLEYAYSVIYARALPDARDGLKPVQRRILFQMDQMGLRPERGHVKSARVVGEVMGKLHPHGDAAIYDTLVRMAQPFSLRLPLVDGHGNFGSLDNGPAAPRYTEARLAPAALAMTESLDEDVVDFVPNYDNQYLQPQVLPSALPNLLVNGASGIAVGMATNMAPHNLGEVVAAARHLIEHPDATLDDLMTFVPGPDLPSGGKIVGLQGIRDAYETGRGTFRTRATVRIENVTARKKGIIVTELPYLVGPERVIDRIKDAVEKKKVTGISGVTDLTDRHHGLRLVIEVKNSFNPEAVLAQLYRATPLEDSFGINNVALVDGKPRTLGLKELLEVYVEHRLTVVRRRSEHRLAKKSERLHLIEGLLIAIADIDEVIQVIRTSETSTEARERLMVVFDLSEPQAEYILELRLRRLTKFSRIELQGQADELAAEISELQEILGSERQLRQVVSDELASVSLRYSTPRRTVLLESEGAGAQVAAPDVPLQVPDVPTTVTLSTTGLIARLDAADSGFAPGEDQLPLGEEAPPLLSRSGPRVTHDAIASVAPARTHGDVGLATSHGRVVRLNVLDVPALAVTGSAPSLAGGAPVSELVSLEAGERVIGLASLERDDAIWALATSQGRVKRLRASEFPKAADSFDIMSLDAGDTVVGFAPAEQDSARIVLITDDAQLLHFPVEAVRPQGRGATGVVGIKLAPDARVLALGVIASEEVAAASVVTVAAASEAPLIDQYAKVTPLDRYPGKGRATMGVRAHRMRAGHNALVRAWVGLDPRAVGDAGQPVALPEPDERRDGSGQALSYPLSSIG
ncbi:MAG: DNA topoisomerase IV subunit A [Bowdeniella nasicola]|nr:DNA topoisomerase IV subunit A [Bowdeniella nasicola]